MICLKHMENFMGQVLKHLEMMLGDLVDTSLPRQKLGEILDLRHVDAFGCHVR